MEEKNVMRQQALFWEQWYMLFWQSTYFVILGEGHVDLNKEEDSLLM